MAGEQSDDGVTYNCRIRLVSGGELRYTYDMENNRITMESKLLVSLVKYIEEFSNGMGMKY